MIAKFNALHFQLNDRFAQKKSSEIGKVFLNSFLLILNEDHLIYIIQQFLRQKVSLQILLSRKIMLIIFLIAPKERKMTIYVIIALEKITMKIQR